MAADKGLAVVVLHFGSIELTRDCLRSVISPEASFIVVDNSRGVISEKDLPLEMGSAEIIVTGENLGFAGGMNAGTRKAFDRGARRVVILNNDTVAEPGFIGKVSAAFARNEGRKICFSPLILDASGKKIWFGGGVVSWITGKARHLGFGSTVFPDEPFESDFLTGCAACFTKEAAEEAGLMEEDYFLYWEDVDWSSKLRGKGYTLLIRPEMRIRHAGSASTGLESRSYLYYYHRNHLAFLFRNCPVLLLPLSLAGFALNLARVCAAWTLKHGKEGRLKTLMTLKGVWHFFLGRRGPMPGGI